MMEWYGYIILALGISSITFLVIAVWLVFVVEDLKLNNAKILMRINRLNKTE